MAQPTISVLDSTGATVVVNTINPNGQATDANSQPVVLPTDQITALTPPTNTGYSTSALQTTGNTSVASIDTKTPALGQALAAASSPVVLTAAQLTTLTPPTNTGYSTAANQTTANTSLASIDTKTPAAGQAVMASSSPVVIASDQSVVPVKDIAFKQSYNFTRPADTTAYSIGDALSNATSSPTQASWTVGAANQYGIIEKVIIISSQKGNPLPQLMAYIFGATLASATFNDNAALDIDNTTYITGGHAIPCVETSSVASRSRTSATGLNLPFQCDASGKLYGVFQWLNAYVPANAEVFYIFLEGKLR